MGDQDEDLIAEIIMLLDSAITDGQVPSAAGGKYASPKAVAYWKHTTPAHLAFNVADDAVRTTFRILRERGRLS